MKRILIVGGYGDVGTYLVEDLIVDSSNNIIIGGRNKSKAHKLINKYKNKNLSYMKIDIYDKSSYIDMLNDIEIVVMCLSPSNNNFSKYCLDNKINYIDISPSHQIASELISMNQECIENNSTCILGVGINPGLSTLLVSKISKEFDYIQNTELSLMLGVGDKYGKDSLRWLIENLSNRFTYIQNGNVLERKPFDIRKRVKFLEPLNTHYAYEFNLADQQIISNTLFHKNISTYFCYDSKNSTRLVRLFTKLRIFKLTKYPIAYKFIEAFIILYLNIVKYFASDIFAINVDIKGHKNGLFVRKIGNIKGKNSAKTTGKVIAYTVKKLINRLNKPGVYYLNQLFDIDDYIAYLDIQDIEVKEIKG